MADDKKPDDKVTTAQLERLGKLANAAAAASQGRQWRARQNGFQEQKEASEVRDLTNDAEARAQAEAALQRMMSNPKGKGRR